MTEKNEIYSIEEFQHPPEIARLFKIIHSLPKSEQDQQELIEQLLAQGFGGLATNAWWEKGYLRVTENVSALDSFLERAKAAGLCLWLYDELGYPSGTAGGMTLEGHPEWEVLGLCVRSQIASEGAVRMKHPPGEWITAFAFPAGEEQSDTRQPFLLEFRLQNGYLEAELPEGEWRAVIVTKGRLLEGYQSCQGSGWKVPRPYPDLMNPEPVDRFLEVTHERYAEVLGEDLGKYFFATFTDEPSSMAQSFPMRDYAVLPWSPMLSQLLEERYDSSLESLLPALTADPGSKGQMTRYRYFSGVAELMAENFFGRLQDWCQEHNLLSGGHLLLEETMMAHISLYGDLFRCLRRMDVPGIDVLSSIPENVPWHTARMVSSVTSLTGKTYTMSEPSAHAERVRSNSTDPPLEEIRGALNRQILGGITCFDVYYRFDSLSEEEIVELNAYVGRCAMMLTGGHRLSRIAVLYPIETLWTRWLAEPTAVHAWFAIGGGHPHARRVDETFLGTSELLYKSRLEFDYIDSQALIDASVQSGALVHGDQAWDVVILPEVDTLPLAAWKRLETFRKGGGTILALGAKPLNSESEFPSVEVSRIAECMFDPNEQKGTGVFLHEWNNPKLIDLLRSNVGAGLEIANDESPLRYTHRIRGEEEIIFVINDSNLSFEEVLTLPLRGLIQRCDPITGEVTSLGSGDAIRCCFKPYQGVLFRSFTKER